MSFTQLIQNFSGNTLLNRRRALVAFSLLVLTACSRPAKEVKQPASHIAYYTCPMHPFVHLQDPQARCPVCGMDLVPVTKSAATSEAMPEPATVVTSTTPASTADMSNGTVNIAPERLQEIGARTEVVCRRVLTRTLRAPARTEIDESALRDINVKAGAGYIEKLYANYEGKTVRKGEPLMRVLCEGWLQTQIDYIKAYRNWRRTPATSPMNYGIPRDNQLELMRARIRVWDLSEDQIRDLEKFAIGTDELDLRTGHGLSGSFDVLAPFDGYVRAQKAVEGMRFETGQSLLQLADHSHVWIVAEFPEDQAPYVNVGQRMTVTFPSMPGEKIESQISFLDPHVDENQRRIRARLVIGDPKHQFHPGLFAEVSGLSPLGSRLSISTGAVVPTGDKNIVFIDLGGGKLEPREIGLGVHSGDYDEVVSGLSEGDRVIASANFLIDAESRIQGVLKTWGAR